MAEGFKQFHGDSFKDDITVFRSDERGKVSGNIKLDGKDTLVDLFCEHMLDEKRSIEGWFDVVLYKDHRVDGEDPILLHNAMYCGTRRHHPDLQAWRVQIYPNYIIYGADALGDGHTIDTLTFSIEGLENFFPYRDVETHWIEGLEENEKQAILVKLREHTESWMDNESKGYGPVRYDFSAPRRVKIEHKRTEIPAIEVHGTEYKVFGFGYANRRTENSLTISLPSPVTIDAALDRMWEWSWFFNQIAYEQLDLLSLRAKAGKDSDVGDAEFYLPNLVRQSAKPTSHLFPGYIPFHEWTEVEQQQEWMTNWLAKREERRVFRARVNATIPGRQASDVVTQIGNLCGAIDSLTDFDDDSQISRGTRKAMATAAREASIKGGEPVEIDRLSGLMGLINKTSLSAKVSSLLTLASPNLSDELLSTLVKQIVRLRQSSAHGQSMGPDTEPMALPISQILSSACVLYDLNSSAIGIEGYNPNMLLAGRTLEFGLSNFKSLLTPSPEL